MCKNYVKSFLFLLQDIEMAMYHYKISSDLRVFGAAADYIRLKYTYDKNVDLLSALEKMLNNTEALPNKHNTLSCIGSYYLFLKRDLITALEKYGQIMDADPDSSALKVCESCFLNCSALVIQASGLCVSMCVCVHARVRACDECLITMETDN